MGEKSLDIAVSANKCQVMIVEPIIGSFAAV